MSSDSPSDSISLEECYDACGDASSALDDGHAAVRIGARCQAQCDDLFVDALDDDGTGGADVQALEYRRRDPIVGCGVDRLVSKCRTDVA